MLQEESFFLSRVCIAAALALIAACPACMQPWTATAAALSAMKRIYLSLEWCCLAPLAVVPGPAAPLGVEIDAVVVRVPSHVVPVRKGCHRSIELHFPNLIAHTRARPVGTGRTRAAADAPTRGADGAVEFRGQDGAAGGQAWAGGVKAGWEATRSSQLVIT